MTRKFLRLTALILSLALGCTVAAGCGGSSAAKGPTRKPGVLRVAMECAYAPYNWTQSTDKNGAVPIQDSKDFANGYDVKMAKLLAKELGYKLEIVKSDWDSLIPAVQSGVVDCVIAGQSITPERLQNVDFTQPYYYATIVTLTKKDSPFAKAKSVADLKGARATSQLNTIWYDKCLPQIPDVQKLAGQADAPAMLAALHSGSCDIVVTDQPTGKAALIAYPDLTLLDFGGGAGDFKVDDSDINIGISLRKGNNELKDLLNKALSKLTKEDFSRMMDEAIAIQPLSK